MLSSLTAVQLACGVCLVVGSSIWLMVLGCAFSFRARRYTSNARFVHWPAVTLLKPVYGLEKNLGRNLRTACEQVYPDYQVVYSVQRVDDPAIPLLRALQREFGSERVSVVIESVSVGLNGKINNLAGALPHARHELLVISDSDVRLRPDFLRQIVAPLADPNVGAVSTFFRARDAGTWYERMEQLSLNADQFALAMLASATGLVDFCFGASTALSKQTLAEIGGLAALGDYLVEDNEMGLRVQRAGKRLVDIPYVVDTTIDLPSAAQWWQKQTYWDQNTRAAIPALFVASLVLRTIPFGLLFATLRGWDALGVSVLLAAFGVRMAAVIATLGVALRDNASLRSVWLVPIKDVVSLVWFVRAFLARTVVWRGVEMTLARDGRLLPLTAAKPGAAIVTESERAS